MAEYSFYKRLFEIMDATRDIVILFDDLGRIIDINHEGMNKLKYPKPHLINMSIFDLVADENRSEAKKIFKDIQKGGTYNGTHIQLHDKAGTKIHIDAFVGSDHIDQLKVYFLIAKDISSLIVNQELFTQMFRNNPLPTIMTREKDGTIVDVNEEFLKFTNYERNFLLGKTTIEAGFYSRATRQSIFDALKANNGVITNLRIDINTRSGKAAKGLLAVQKIFSNNESFLLGVFNDQTKEFQNQDKLDKSLTQQTLISQVAALVGSSEDFHNKINQTLDLVKQYTSICHSYLFEFEKKAYTFKSHKNLNYPFDPQNISDTDLSDIENVVGQSGLLYSGDLKSINLELNRLFNPYKAKSVLIVPIKYNQINIGFVGFTQCILVEEWDESDGSTLRTIGDFISNMYVRNREEEDLQNKVSENEDTKNAILNVLDDVEIEKDKSQKLADDLRKFALAVDQTSDHIVITDTQGKIIYANKAAETVTGFSFAEMQEKTPGDLWGGLMDKEFYKHFWEIISIQKQAYQGEFLNKRKNKETYYAEATVSPVLNESNEVLFYVGVERDVTKLKEVDRMKTEFISLASHQLRTPLSAIKWYLEMLLAGDAGKLTAQQEDFVSNINISNERMIDLVNALLNVSRIESGRIIIEPHPTNVNDLIEGVINEVNVRAREKKIKIVMSVQKGVPLVKMDPRLIRNALMNLLTNAVKYSPNNTEIAVKAVKDKEFVIFEVTDHGYGIPKEDQEKVFSKFYRGKNIVKFDTNGNGIGLYLVKSIIKASGGDIWFESVVNHGSTFWFKIPIVGVPAKQGEVTLEDIQF
jgi:PAS domain S-box-containing protein